MSSSLSLPNDARTARRSAVLVAVQLPGVSDADHAADLAELGRLVTTLGFDVAGTVTQKRDALAAAAVLGEGKLKELAELTGGKGVVPTGAPEVKTKARAKWAAEKKALTGASDRADEEDSEDDDDEPSGKAAVVVVDHEISPSQARNLERATGAEVLDRTGVIVDIFHRHARSREARLQVEIARLNYVAPRMRESPGGKERQRGRGAGEAAIELDRRKVRDRIAELREQLAAIQREQANRRQARQDQLRVALVGYTNAGKSSLMRALTGSQVLVEDKLFATLDEALEASLLLYVVDAADPTHEAQLDVTRTVLRDIGAHNVPSMLLLNKVDRVDDEARASLRRLHRGETPILLSAHDPNDVLSLRETILAFFEAKMVEGELVVPYAKQALIGEVYENARVVGESYDESGTRLSVRALPAAIARLQRALEK